MWQRKWLLSKVLLGTPYLLLILLAVACGTASPPSQPVVEERAVEKEVEVVKEVEKIVVATPTPASVPSAVEVNPGKLTVMVGDFSYERFDPIIATGNSVQQYMRTLHGMLLSDTPEKDMVPGIASEWEVSADGLTLTFTIREGVKFHDGSELTPEDVLWTLQHYMSPEAREWTRSTLLRVSGYMERIELSEPDKVSLTTNVVTTELANLLSEATVSVFPILPKRDKLHDVEVELAYDKNPIGAGPMKMASWTPSYVMRFERFDDFYYQPKNGFPEDKRVNFGSLDLFLVQEEATRVSALRAGEADIIPVSIASRDQVEAGGGRLIFGEEGNVLEVRFMGCHLPQYPCHDKRVRQALDYAIDKELIRDRLFGGPEAFRVKGWSIVTPNTIGYTPAIDPWPYDPDKARQLLAEAGYPGGQGFGKLILNTHPASALPLQVESAQLGAEFWRRELGLEVEVRVGEGAAISQAGRAGELDGQMTWRENQARKDATSGTMLFYGDPGYVPASHADPQMFTLVQETLRIVDPEQRAEGSKDLYQRLREETYRLGMGYANVPWGVGPRVVTWSPYPFSAWIHALHTITLK